MQHNLQPSKLNVWHKQALTYALVTVLTVIIAECLGLGVLALLQGEISWGGHIVLVVMIAAVIGTFSGVWASRSIARRVRTALEVSRAWLRGNLSLRMLDLQGDDLGLLAGQLNMLVEQLEEDEQDLDVLRERNTRLSDQVRALAVVEERNRLARELHDSVKQHLFSLTMTASAIRTHFERLDNATEESARQTIDDLTEMVREIETAAQTAQRETTRLIEDLRPGSLQEQGLARALNDYTLLFGAQEHILVYLDVHGDAGRLLPSAVEALYRVTQEALHNVARHAKATRVDVHLRCTPERAILTIDDNGIGFDTGQVSRGLGLANMQERLMSIGGRLVLDSQIGSGTTVTAEVELPHALGMSIGTTVAGSYHPDLSNDNWTWLGAKLVIPVGQTWPWLPADQQHLHGPLVEPGAAPVKCRRATGFLGLGHAYTLTDDQNTFLVRLHRSASGFEWEAEDASWALHTIQGLSGRMVLTRNEQPLAAIQFQGRQMHTWSEIVYDGRGYCLVYTRGDGKDGAHVKSGACTYALADEFGQNLLCFEDDDSYQISLARAIPLPLLVMVVARILDERSVAASN
jgi:signal transduction histidine kinase